MRNEGLLGVALFKESSFIVVDRNGPPCNTVDCYSICIYIMPYQHFWLVLWMVIGTFLRFINLGKLPPWTDESATIVFSLGNSFYNVPLNQFIDLQTLLEPLRLNPNAGIADVVNLLLTESTHPPLYFVLTHLWLKLFPSTTGLVSVWAARSLSALLGVLSIPAIFYFAKLVSRSLVSAQIAAAMMAVSPYGIFLATQARHYTLVILITIASLSCFVAAFRSFEEGKTIPLWLVFVWIGINCIGIATHYFFVLTLAAMAIAFIPLAWRNFKQKTFLITQWRRIYLVAFGSLVGCLVWLPVLLSIRGRSPTDWIYQSNAAERWLEPIGRFLIWLMSMVVLLPTSLYDFSLGIVIFFGICSLLFWCWYLPYLLYGLKQYSDRTSGLKTYFWAAIALFFLFTYLGMDLTLAGRFHFVYFPVVITLIATSLGYFWQDEGFRQPVKLWSKSIKRSKRIVVIVLSLGLFSGTIALFNLGYLQNHRPDLAIAKIAEGTRTDVAIATTYKHHGQTGRIIGLAWGLKNLPNIHSPRFFLTQKRETLTEELSKLKRPLDLWLINHDKIELEAQNCFLDPEYQGMSGQYKYKLYRCQDI